MSRKSWVIKGENTSGVIATVAVAKTAVVETAVAEIAVGEIEVAEMAILHIDALCPWRRWSILLAPVLLATLLLVVREQRPTQTLPQRRLISSTVSKKDGV